MLSKKMQDALNGQVNAEMYSSYLYLAMEAYFESISLNGFANWMRVQTQEELTHAMKFYEFINERGGRIALAAIDAPPGEWDGPLAVFEAVYEHEQKVTKSINGLLELSYAEKDHATVNFLQWFVSEQVEEEASAQQNVKKMEMIGDNKAGLFMIDKELGARGAGQ